jgi:hypothetical protein
MNKCVTEGVKKSTGPVNEAAIKEGCRKLCEKYREDQKKK